MKYFKQEFIKMKNRILGKENFSFMRYCDSEYLLIHKKEISAGTQSDIMDRCTYPAVESKLGKDLNDLLKIDNNAVYYGIPAQSQSKELYNFYTKTINVSFDNITFVDVFINSNYFDFRNFINNELKQEIVVIANEESEKHISGKKLNNLILKDFFSVPDQCVEYYEHNSEVLKNNLKRLANYENTIFLVSAGPMSAPIIYNLFKSNPNNKYIDVGSALDEFTKGKITRPYMIPGNAFNVNTPIWT